MPGSIRLGHLDVKSFDVVSLDIKLHARYDSVVRDREVRHQAKGEDQRIQGVDAMDAVTSFELEAQRRRETVASDRRTAAWAQADASIESFEKGVVERPAPASFSGRLTEQMTRPGDCQPSPATR
jgi:hypothetical protein